MKQTHKIVVLTLWALGFFSATASATTDIPPETLWGGIVPSVFLDPNILYSFTGTVPTGGAIADELTFSDDYNYSGYTFTLTDLSQPDNQIDGLAANLELWSLTYLGSSHARLTGGLLDTIELGTQTSFTGDASPNKYSIQAPIGPGAQYVLGSFLRLDIVGFASEGDKYRIDVVRDIPEPDTYALMLAGLSILGFVGNKRHKANV